MPLLLDPQLSSAVSFDWDLGVQPSPRNMDWQTGRPLKIHQGSTLEVCFPDCTVPLEPLDHHPGCLRHQHPESWLLQSNLQCQTQSEFFSFFRLVEGFKLL